MDYKVLLVNSRLENGKSETQNLMHSEQAKNISFLNGFEGDPIYDICPISVGLLSIAGSLREDGHDVRYFDFNLSQEKDYYKLLNSFDPDYLCATAVTPSFYNAKNIFQKSKELNPNLKTILGGHHGTYLHKEIMEDNNFDIVVRGEGELIIRDIMKKPLETIDGITYRDNNIKINSGFGRIRNLNSLPLPAYDLVSNKIKNKIWNIYGSKGCPMSCLFCSGTDFNGGTVRFRSIENVIKEINLIESFGGDTLLFYDDTFTLIPTRVESMCDELKNNTDIKSWRADTRVDKVNNEMFSQMKSANCSMVAYGIESGSQTILNRSRKGITIEQIHDACKLAKKNDLDVLGYWIVGLPGETEETADETYRFASRLKKEDLIDIISPSILIPYPGTKIYNNPENYGIKIEIDDFSRWDEDGVAVISNENLSSNELCGYWKRLGELNIE